MLFDTSSILRLCLEPAPWLPLNRVQILDVSVYEAFAAVLSMVHRGQVSEDAAKHIMDRLAFLLSRVTILRVTPQTVAKAVEVAKSLGVGLTEAVLLHVASQIGVLVTEDPETREKASKLNIAAVTLDELSRQGQPAQTQS